ncbi:MAG: D-aminoacylase [Acidobacteria bacterium]|nr:D-aminoacylase [Acidobacteriota bacterium]
MRRANLILIGAWILVVVSLVGCTKKRTEDFDILIRNGKIVDGTGTSGFQGDIGIIDDTIVELGDLARKTAVKTIDAEGSVVSPGFIDVHTHSDEGLGRPGSNANLNYLIQGVTTVVTGNCGVGTFEIADTKAKWEEQGIGTNAVHLVGFGDVRRAVLGTEPRAPEPEELEKMRSILRQAMREGAWGMSTGLEYVPDRYSTTEEIIQAAKVIGEFGGVYASHQRNEFDRVPEATRETIRIAEAAGVRALVSHLKVCRKNAWGMMKDVVEVINDARARGVDIVADMYPYHFAGGGPIIPIATNSGWSPFHLPNDLEPFAELREKMSDRNLQDEQKKKLREQYVDELAKALADDSKRRQIRQSVLMGNPHQLNPVAVGGWDSYLVVLAEKNGDLVGKILSDIAEEQGREPFDLAADLVIDEPDLYVACGVMSEEDMRHAMEQDWLMFSSDGDAVPMVDETDRPVVDHPRAFGSQTRVLRKFVREEKILTLENAIRKMTSLPAQFLRMKDRGLLASGYKADVVIFDPETVRDRATHANAHEYSTGVETVIVGGKISIENGEYNGALNGKLLLLTENH